MIKIKIFLKRDKHKLIKKKEKNVQVVVRIKVLFKVKLLALREETVFSFD